VFFVVRRACRACGYFVAILLVSLLQSSICSALVPYAASSVIGQESFDYGYKGPQSVGAPYGVSLDASSHLLFIADQSKNRVLVFETDPISNKPASKTAVHVLGQPNFATYSAGSGDSGISCPQGVFADSANKKLYVVDGDNNRVVIFDYSLGITDGMAASDVLGQPDFTTTSAGTTSSKMYYPVGIAMDSVEHRLFIAEDGNNRVLVFNLNSSNVLVDYTADNVLGQSNFTSSSAATTRSGLFSPASVAMDSVNNRLYISDKRNSRVIIHDISTISDGQDAVAMLGQVDYFSRVTGTTASNFYYCDGIAVDIAGHRLFVSEQNNYRILEFDLDSTNLPIDGVADGVIGQTDFVSRSTRYLDMDTDTIAAGQALMFDPINNYLYASNYFLDRVGIFDVSSITTGEDVVDLIGMQRYTSDSVVDVVRHRLFVVESQGNRVMVYNLDSNNNLIDTTPDNVIGQLTLVSQISGTSASRLNCIDASCSVDYDADRDMLFVGDGANGRVLLFDLSSGITNGMDATYVLGKPDFTDASCGSPTQRDMCANHGGLTYDSVNKRLFVVDGYNYRVLVFDLTTLESYKTASYVIGQSDFTSSDYGTSATRMTLDYAGIKIDPTTQYLYVSDAENNRVMVFNASPATIANGMSASYVIGQPDFTSSDYGTSQQSFDYPQGLALDTSRQELYVFGWGNMRVMRFDLSNLATNMSASAVIGQPDFTTGSTRVASQTAFRSDSINMGFDVANRRLYLPDSVNHRVMVFELAHISTATLSDATVGVNYSATIESSGIQGTASYSLASGTLPTGLSFDASTHKISGMPTQSGTYTFSISVADDNGAVGINTDTRSYSLTVENGGSGGGTDPSGGSGTSSASAESASVRGRAYVYAQSDEELLTQTSLDEMYLSSVTGFSSISGQTIDIVIGQVVHMSLQSGQQHTVTLKSIASDQRSVVVTFASTPQDVTLDWNVARPVDLDADGNPDVMATLVDVDDDDTVSLNLRDVSLPVDQSATVFNDDAQSLKMDNSDDNFWGIAVLIIGAIAVLVVATIGVVVAKKRYQ
jgi:DNA-binding beta-propeller fold protein YncE